MVLIEFDYTDGHVYKKSEKGVYGILCNENNENYWDVCEHGPMNVALSFDSKCLFVDKNFGFVYLSSSPNTPPNLVWAKMYSRFNFDPIDSSNEFHTSLHNLMRLDDVVDFTSVHKTTDDTIFGLNPCAINFVSKKDESLFGLNPFAKKVTFNTHQSTIGKNINNKKENSFTKNSQQHFDERKQIDEYACEKIEYIIMKYKDKLDVNELDLMIDSMLKCIYW